ncbi:hypothetical protein FQN60_008212 [Etheostoma spectabile]|uniref:Uncharacterized protein n=1 Tax=Etheostoma spectabile TaxID=54343 RepID=A0A5J5CRK2_9PERO|nr:hypothetical protein FQN60_008212 [Etheostoma spectabile]
MEEDVKPPLMEMENAIVASSVKKLRGGLVYPRGHLVMAGASLVCRDKGELLKSPSCISPGPPTHNI